MMRQRPIRRHAASRRRAVRCSERCSAESLRGTGYRAALPHEQFDRLSPHIRQRQRPSRRMFDCAFPRSCRQSAPTRCQGRGRACRLKAHSLLAFREKPCAGRYLSPLSLSPTERIFPGPKDRPDRSAERAEPPYSRRLHSPQLGFEKCIGDGRGAVISCSPVLACDGGKAYRPTGGVAEHNDRRAAPALAKHDRDLALFRRIHRRRRQCRKRETVENSPGVALGRRRRLGIAFFCGLLVHLIELFQSIMKPYGGPGAARGHHIARGPSFRHPLVFLPPLDGAACPFGEYA